MNIPKKDKQACGKTCLTESETFSFHYIWVKIIFKKMCITLWICLFGFLVEARSNEMPGRLSGGMDIHSHLFLELGIPTWFYEGCFRCPLQAENWSSLRGSKANETSLLQSRLSLVVASLHAVSFGSHNIRDSIRMQIQEAKDFVERNPQWVIATSAGEARAAIKKKKQVLVLSLEGAHGTLETEEDFREFIREGPISIVTPLHLSDDEFGGAAFLWGVRGFLNFFAFFKSVFTSKSFFIEDVRANSEGLTEEGELLTARLLGAKVWIDLTHASDRAQMSILSAMAKFKQPLLYTHTVLREYLNAERGLARWQIEEIKQRGGMVGLLPSRNYLVGTPGYECDFKAYFNQYKKLGSLIGRNSVTMGSDFNAPLAHLAPGCGTENPLDREGFWKQDQVVKLWEVMNEFQPNSVDPNGQLEQFLKLWSRVR